ncbi:MAG: flagellar motor protein [Armatimonadetes bacterium]|nr:flagellar motor protein [Armatimonadota bacterium]
MDKATLLGLLLAFGGVVLGVALEGGHLSAYLSLSSFLIVIIGSLGAMVLAFPMHDVIRFGQCCLVIFRGVKHDWESAVRHMMDIATQARRNGVLSLEPTIKEEKDDFVKSGLRMMVDGADTEVLEHVLDQKVESRHYVGKQNEKMFEVLGGFMPTLGIVGTVTSLIHVLGNLSEPDKLGSGIAAAFTATLYGVGIANLAVLPIAAKMRAIAQEEATFYRMVAAGLVAVQSGDNPLWVEQKMRAFVPAHEAAKTARAAVGKKPGPPPPAKTAAA